MNRNSIRCSLSICAQSSFVNHCRNTSVRLRCESVCFSVRQINAVKHTVKCPTSGRWRWAASGTTYPTANRSSGITATHPTYTGNVHRCVTWKLPFQPHKGKLIINKKKAQIYYKLYIFTESQMHECKCKSHFPRSFEVHLKPHPAAEFRDFSCKCEREWETELKLFVHQTAWTKMNLDVRSEWIMHASAQFWKRAHLFWGNESGTGRGPASLHAALCSPARPCSHHVLELVLEGRVQPLDPVRVHSMSWLALVCLKCEWSDGICWWCCSSQAEMHRLCSVSSEQLERRYQEYLRQDQEDAGIKFTAGNRFYELRFRGLFRVETRLGSWPIQHTYLWFHLLHCQPAFRLRPPNSGQTLCSVLTQYAVSFLTDRTYGFYKLDDQINEQFFPVCH